MDSELGPLLIEAGILTPNQLALVLARKHRQGGILLSHLIEENFVDEDQIVSLFCSRRAYRRASEEEIAAIPQEVLALVPAHLAWRYGVLPLRVERETLYLVAADPSNSQVQDEIAYLTGHRVVPMITRFSLISKTLLRVYGPETASFPPSFPPPYDPQAGEPWESSAPLQDEDLVTLLNGAIEENGTRVPTLPGIGSSPASQQSAPRFYASVPSQKGSPSSQTPFRVHVMTDSGREIPAQSSSPISPNPTLKGIGNVNFQHSKNPTLKGIGAIRRPETISKTSKTEEIFLERTDTLREQSPPIFFSPTEEDTSTLPTELLPEFFLPKDQELSSYLEAIPTKKTLQNIHLFTPPDPVGSLLPPPNKIVSKLEEAKEVNDVLDAIFFYLEKSFSHRIFFVIKSDIAQGYRGVGLSFPPFTYQVPLRSPSLFTSILLSQIPFIGEISKTKSTKALLERLESKSCSAILFPVVLRKRSVGIFLGAKNRGKQSIDGQTFLQLRRVSFAITQAFYRILQKKKL